MIEALYQWTPYASIIVMMFAIIVAGIISYGVKIDIEKEKKRITVMGRGIYFKQESGTAPKFEDTGQYIYKFVTTDEEKKEFAAKLAQVKIPKKSPETGEPLDEDHRANLKRMIWNKAKELRKRG